MSEGGRVRRKRRSRIPVRKATGLYVHSSPPTVVPVHPSIVRQWLRGGEINRLQEIVLKKKIDELHAAARIGKIENVDAIIKSEPRVNLELSRDSSGTGLLHKAVIHGHIPLQEWLLRNYPKTVEVLDKEKRNPLHYAGGNEEIWNRLVAGGADTSTVDREGNSPAFYMNHPRRLRPPAPDSRSRTNLQANQGIVVKPSNIRIWIHDKDLGRLQKVLWEGMGDKLKTETSSQPLVRRFLNAVPYIMGSIRDVHSAAISNDVELLKAKTSDPVPKDILLSKDANGLNALHKAAGLGNMEVARAIIDRAPEAVNAKDHLDRTPLHYAAAVKDQNQMYQLLIDSNATDHLEDKRGNTPSHYRARPSDLDGPKLLNVVPEAPRTAHIFPPSWDWRLLSGDATIDSPITSPRVETSPRISDIKESEEPSKQEEEKQVANKPPEIEPSPEGEIDEQKEVEQKDETEAPGVSDDEGVGSEANPSIENTSTPLSDTVNEEEEISGARLGHTMTLTTSLFSSDTPGTEESINGMDSGNEDGDTSESRMINVENGEVEPSQDDLSTKLPGNLDGISEDYLNQAIDVEVSRNQELQQTSDNQQEISDEKTTDEFTDEQPHGITFDRTQPDMGVPMPNFDDQPPAEVDTSESVEDGNVVEVSQDVSANGEQVTEMHEIVKSDSREQTDNQNIFSISDSINLEPALSARSEEDKLGDGDDSENYNKILGSTQDFDETFINMPPNIADEVKKEGKNDSAEQTHHEKPSIPNELTQLEEMSTFDEKLEEKNREYIPENDTKQVEEIQRSQRDENIPADVPNEQSIVGVTLPNSPALNSKPSSPKSVVGTPKSRQNMDGMPQNITTPSAENSYQEEGLDHNETNGNSPLGGHLEAKEQADGTSTNNSKEPEDGNDIGWVANRGLEKVETADGERTLGSQSDLQGNHFSPSGENTESNILIAKDEKDVREIEEPNEDEHGDDDVSSEHLDRPITTRSTGGSRAEILAITPALPEGDEEEADDQKAVEDTEEEDRAVAEELVIAGDMESMAEMVLNGRGSALLNMTSNNPDVQLFINNIPQYISKIERVHVAAREGDLRGVQTALDRRKFAVARDNSTPLKPTPLHVATLFGRTSVLRYLAGRFPETMHAQDAGGRTALHYAATLPDNGHFYSLLVTLGADKNIIDNEGKTAEYYLKNKGELSRDELLNEYQNRPVPVDTSGLNFNRFSDKGAEIIKGGYPIFNPDEGQYLADSLGEPLIKGLTEVAHVRPTNPVVHLANFLLVYSKPEEAATNNNRLPSAKRAVTAGMEDTPTELIGPNEGENVENMTDQLLDENRMENEDDTDVTLVGEREGEELEEKEDEEETLDEDNVSIGEDPPDPVDPAFKPTNRDEHGQTILHFAAARSHGRNAIFQLLQEMDVNVALRDGLYRTARDISEQMEIRENVEGIDKFVVALAARGENDKLTELLLEGYDHILDADDNGENILDMANERENVETVELLQSIRAFEERREKLIRAIRFGSMRQVRELFQETPNKRHLAVAKNQQGRCSLHVAVLAQHENIVEYIAKRFPSTLHIGDNLMRTPLHHAMGVDKVEPLSRILIAAGAQRVVKDLKGRQPSYYFMSKTDIQKLQDEEEALRV